MSNNITITGDLGSGKSSVTAILREKLGFEVVSVGLIQRKLAARYKLDATEFNKYMETHPEIDAECDAMVAELGRQNNHIFDSRLAWHFVKDSFKVYLSVDEDVAVGRILGDRDRIGESFTGFEEAKKNIRERRNSELMRFSSQYGVRLDCISNYDLIINTSYRTPPDVAEQILNNYHLYKDHEKNI